MDSDAGSSTACRRRRFSSSPSSFSSCSLSPFLFVLVFHGSLETLGYVVLSAVDVVARRCCYYAKALWIWIQVLTCNPLQPLLTAHVSDLCLTTCVCGVPYLSWWFELKLLSGSIIGFKVLAGSLCSPCSITLFLVVYLVNDVCGVPLPYQRPKLESQDLISTPAAFFLDNHPLCSDEDYSPSSTCLTRHFKPSCPPRARSASFDDWGLPPRTPPAAVHIDVCSLYISLLVFIDLRLDFISGKFSWLQHGNVEGKSLCLSLVIAFMESIVKLFGAIFGGFPNCSSISHHQISTPTRAKTNQVILLSWIQSKGEDCSPLTLFSIKASNTSSCRCHERLLSIPLCEKDSFLGYVANGLCQLPYVLMPYVMDLLGPEGTTILIPMGIEVMKISTSRYTVTIYVEEFEERCNLPSSLLVCGTFELYFNLLSSLAKLVSLSFFYLVLNVSIRFVHLFSDVAFIFVID